MQLWLFKDWLHALKNGDNLGNQVMGININKG